VYLNGLHLGMAPSLPVVIDVQRCSLPISPRNIFINTVSAMSSALCPVTILLTPNKRAPRSNACLRKTPQNVQLFFRPTFLTIFLEIL